ncbi:Rgp1-domain-containing protein [Coprinopsis marcescibilis]|uniref:Rgp1-domain-containing protein n=1 Tax=Coprinopsis marcescibilis TaxID=230819 RepID=A0A5C3L5T4_COPMA|nr:Rgp1-domain-containing protein [Coprinopsis marcescibilis]
MNMVSTSESFDTETGIRVIIKPSQSSYFAGEPFSVKITFVNTHSLPEYHHPSYPPAGSSATSTDANTPTHPHFLPANASGPSSSSSISGPSSSSSAFFPPHSASSSNVKSYYPVSKGTMKHKRGAHSISSAPMARPPTSPGTPRSPSVVPTPSLIARAKSMGANEEPLVRKGLVGVGAKKEVDKAKQSANEVAYAEKVKNPIPELIEQRRKRQLGKSLSVSIAHPQPSSNADIHVEGTSPGNDSPLRSASLNGSFTNSHRAPPSPLSSLPADVTTNTRRLHTLPLSQTHPHARKHSVLDGDFDILGSSAPPPAPSASTRRTSTSYSAPTTPSASSSSFVGTTTNANSLHSISEASPNSAGSSASNFHPPSAYANGQVNGSMSNGQHYASGGKNASNPSTPMLGVPHIEAGPASGKGSGIGLGHPGTSASQYLQVPHSAPPIPNMHFQAHPDSSSNTTQQTELVLYSYVHLVGTLKLTPPTANTILNDPSSYANGPYSNTKSQLYAGYGGAKGKVAVVPSPEQKVRMREVREGLLRKGKGGVVGGGSMDINFWVGGGGSGSRSAGVPPQDSRRRASTVASGVNSEAASAVSRRVQSQGQGHARSTSLTAGLWALLSPSSLLGLGDEQEGDEGGEGHGGDEKRQQDQHNQSSESPQSSQLPPHPSQQPGTPRPNQLVQQQSNRQYYPSHQRQHSSYRRSPLIPEDAAQGPSTAPPGANWTVGTSGHPSQPSSSNQPPIPHSAVQLLNPNSGLGLGLGLPTGHNRHSALANGNGNVESTLTTTPAMKRISHTSSQSYSHSHSRRSSISSFFGFGAGSGGDEASVSGGSSGIGGSGFLTLGGSGSTSVTGTSVGGGGMGLGVGGAGIGAGGGALANNEETRYEYDSAYPLPTLETQPAMLAVDLRLGPGEEKSYTYTLQLPDNLPPTFRGKTLKFSYELVVGLCRAGKGDMGGGSESVNVSKLMKVPIRLYNSVFVGRPQKAYNLLWPLHHRLDLSLGKGREKEKVVEEPVRSSVASTSAVSISSAQSGASTTSSSKSSSGPGPSSGYGPSGEGSLGGGSGGAGPGGKRRANAGSLDDIRRYAQRLVEALPPPPPPPAPPATVSTSVEAAAKDSGAGHSSASNPGPPPARAQPSLDDDDVTSKTPIFQPPPESSSTQQPHTVKGSSPQPLQTSKSHTSRLLETLDQEEEDAEESEIGCREAVEILTRVTKKVSYDVTKDGVKVAVLTFSKSAYRLGETVLGVVEINERKGRSRVVQMSARLETHENLPTSIAPSSSANANTKQYLKRTYAEHFSRVLSSTTRTSFSLDIPSDASPEFKVAVVGKGGALRPGQSVADDDEENEVPTGGIQWKVRLTLLVAVASPYSDIGTEGVRFKGLVMDGERGEWESSWKALEKVGVLEKVPLVGDPRVINSKPYSPSSPSSPDGSTSPYMHGNAARSSSSTWGAFLASYLSPAVSVEKVYHDGDELDEHDGGGSEVGSPNSASASASLASASVSGGKGSSRSSRDDYGPRANHHNSDLNLNLNTSFDSKPTAYDGIKPDYAGGIGVGVDFEGGDGWRNVRLEVVECEVPVRVWPGNTAFRAMDVVFEV